MTKDRIITRIEKLVETGLVSEEEAPLLAQVASQFNVAITPAMIEILKDKPTLAGIREQFVPSIQELADNKQALSDPVGDDKHQKVPGLIHRYPDRCLLKVMNSCAVYCRFCFRKQMIGKKYPAMTNDELSRAYAYMQDHPEIWEVILSGGDPLLLKPTRLRAIIQALNNIAHVEVIRLHTRIPVVDPARITTELISALKVPKPVYVALHANHPAEFTEAAVTACKSLVDAGLPMISQTVLLKGINDSVDVLNQLMRTFVRNRIKPYYLHHLDLAKGADHFRLTIEEGQALVKALQGKFSGLCQPTYVLDIPGGYGKVPLCPTFLHKTLKNDGAWIVEDYQGNNHLYCDYPS